LINDEAFKRPQSRRGIAAPVLLREGALPQSASLRNEAEISLSTFSAVGIAVPELPQLSKAHCAQRSTRQSIVTVLRHRRR